VVTELAERLMLLADDLPAPAGSRNPGGNGDDAQTAQTKEAENQNVRF
jgi:hypothetical protein